MLNLKELRLSHSSHSSGRTCWRKLEFSKFYSISRRYEQSLAGDVGNCLHTGFQHYLSHHDKEDAQFAMLIDYPIHLNSNPVDVRSVEACYATLEAMMSTPVLAEYSLASVECMGGVVRKAVEVPFEITIKDFSLSNDEHVPLIYTGFIDALMYNELTNEYIVVDIKTTRQNVDDMTPTYRFSDQCLPYAIVLEKMLGHGLGDLSVKYLSVYVDIKQPKIKLYSFERTEREVQDWARGFLVDVQSIKMFYQMQWFPRNGEKCMAFNKPCSYFDICEMRDVEKIQDMLLLNPDDLYIPRQEAPWVTIDLELAA